MNRLQQLQTHNVRTDYMENTNGTNQRRDQLYDNKPRTVSRRIERMPQGNVKNRRSTIH